MTKRNTSKLNKNSFQKLTKTKTRKQFPAECFSFNAKLWAVWAKKNITVPVVYYFRSMSGLFQLCVTFHYSLHYSTNSSLEGVNENECVNSDTECTGMAAAFT